MANALFDNYLDLVEAARTLGIHPQSLRRLIKQKKVPALLFAGKYLIERDKLWFFFGESAKPDSTWYEQEYNDTIKQLENALKWYDTKETDVYRWVTYRASW